MYKLFLFGVNHFVTPIKEYKLLHSKDRDLSSVAEAPSILFLFDVEIDLRSDLKMSPKVGDELSVDVNVSLAEKCLLALSVKDKLDGAGILAEDASNVSKQVSHLHFYFKENTTERILYERQLVTKPFGIGPNSPKTGITTVSKTDLIPLRHACSIETCI